MLAFTHAATGVFAVSVYAMASRPSPTEIAILLASSLLGSVLPDIDHPKSWLGRRLIIISLPLSALVGHRGVTHSMAALALIFAGGFWGLSQVSLDSNLWALSVVGLCLGYASHLFGDWASNSGIPLLWPRKKRYRSPVTFFTGSLDEKVIAFALWGASAYILANIFCV